MGATSARLGKVPLPMAAQAFKSAKLNFDNDNKNFPKSAEEFENNYDTFLYKFRKVKPYTKIVENQFRGNFLSAYNSSRHDFAHSKLMQLHMICEIVSLKDEERDDLLTSLTYLAQKKGKIFGPFGKLY